MKKNTLFASMFVAVGAAASLMSLGSANTVDNADVYLTISGGDLSIGVTGSLDLGTFTVANTDQTVEGTFTAASSGEYFWVEDLRGGDLGYYTTLQVSDMNGSNGSIPAANISLKVDPVAVSLLNGNANPLVVLDSVWSAYRAANTPLTFTKRDPGPNAGVIGWYGVLPSVQVVIPAYQAVGDYTSVITYTLFER